MRVLPPNDWSEDGYMGVGEIYTAMPVVNAIPHVVAARPGIVNFSDLPLITGRFSA
jgi:4-hydroxy-tetrahydrodipicolinate reductase